MSVPLYIGIDAGGTKTAICASTSEEAIEFSLDGPGTNIRRDGLSVTLSTLIDLIHALPQPSKPTSTYLCAGIAGAGNKEIQAALKQKLAIHLEVPTSNIQVRTDASIAYYAAHKDRSGILVITGTGSIIWARTKTGHMVRAGGWGALLGDEGGGFQLGLSALRALSHEIDGGPSTLLSSILCDHYGLCTPSDILDFTYQRKSHISTLAPFVIEAAKQSDQIAQQIIDTQISALAQSLKFLLLSHPHVSPNIVYMGGLTNDPFYVDALKQGLSDVYPDVQQFTKLNHPPVEAAFHLARRMNNQGEV